MARRFVSVNNAPLRTAVVGYGYWGPNLVRNVMERPELEFAGLCERDADARRGVLGAATPASRCSATSPRCSPTTRSTRSSSRRRRARTTRSCARRSRPASTCSSRSRWPRRPTDALDLIEIAARHGRTLMPGHTFVYSPPVNKVKELIDAGRARRGVLRHLVAHEPRQVPARRRDLRPRAARPVDPALLARRAGRRGRRDRPQHLPGRRAGDGVHHAHVRERRERQHPGLLAGAAQGARDDGRRQPPDGPVRRHGRRRGDPRLRPRHGVLDRRRPSASTSSPTAAAT